MYNYLTMTEVRMTSTESTIHIIIPDTQIKDDVPTDQLAWIGQYIIDQFAGRENVKIIHLGDHADMPSLSMYDEGKKEMEGRRYEVDIKAANKGFDILNKPFIDYNKGRAKLHRARWTPERHILLGNHENRIEKAISRSAKLDKVLSTDDLNYAQHGWEVHPFLKPIILDGVTYAHYFYNPMTGIPYSGMAESRLKTIGTSFTMGHQQTLLYGLRFVGGRSQHGLIAGACYLHDEDYKGYQGNSHWRGIIVKHEVHDGSYDPMFVSLNYLCKRYEGVSVQRFTSKKYGFFN